MLEVNGRLVAHKLVVEQAQNHLRALQNTFQASVEFRSQQESAGVEARVKTEEAAILQIYTYIQAIARETKADITRGSGGSGGGGSLRSSH